ncbi:peptidase inhibitor family I36 protein [Streptomyces sp. NPDC002076]
MAELMGSISRRAVAAAAAAVCVGGLGVGLAPAAQAANIDTWSSFSQSCGTYMCLFYSPGLTGGSWRPSGTSYSNLSGYTFSNGQAVRNNAASMGNNTTNCNVTTWISPGFTGPHADNTLNNNWLHPGHAGNLNSYLRNNEASINVNNCT